MASAATTTKPLAVELPVCETKSCHNCGETITRRPRDSKTQWTSRKYCSPRCSNDWRHPSKGYAVEDCGHETPCWIWLGSKNNEGYARRGGSYIHRSNYEAQVGPIAEGLELDHLCRNRACVNPAHLEPVTHADNVLRGNSPAALAARKKLCLRGHILAGDNLYVGSRGRQCRSCHQMRAEQARRAGRATPDPKSALPWSQRPSRNPQLATRIEEMWASGSRIQHIAEAVGLTRAGVRYHLKKRGLYV